MFTQRCVASSSSSAAPSPTTFNEALHLGPGDRRPPSFTLRADDSGGAEREGRQFISLTEHSS